MLIYAVPSYFSAVQKSSSREVPGGVKSLTKHGKLYLYFLFLSKVETMSQCGHMFDPHSNVLEILTLRSWDHW